MRGQGEAGWSLANKAEGSWCSESESGHRIVASLCLSFHSIEEGASEAPRTKAWEVCPTFTAKPEKRSSLFAHFDVKQTVETGLYFLQLYYFTATCRPACSKPLPLYVVLVLTDDNCTIMEIAAARGNSNFVLAPFTRRFAWLIFDCGVCLTKPHCNRMRRSSRELHVNSGNDVPAGAELRGSRECLSWK